MWNTFAFTAEQQKEEAAIKDKLAVDLGEYSPELGYSYSEIAGMSRSQHRSQGMGAAERKGSTKNYLVTIAGDRATKSVFEGIDTSWSRVPGGAEIAPIIEKARDSFTGREAETLLPLLVEARAKVAALKDPLAARKLREIDETIGLVSGLWLDAAADKYAATPGTLRENRHHRTGPRSGPGDAAGRDAHRESKGSRSSTSLPPRWSTMSRAGTRSPCPFRNRSRLRNLIGWSSRKTAPCTPSAIRA